jgi:hypothetical protein
MQHELYLLLCNQYTMYSPTQEVEHKEVEHKEVEHKEVEVAEEVAEEECKG